MEGDGRSAWEPLPEESPEHVAAALRTVRRRGTRRLVARRMTAASAMLVVAAGAFVALRPRSDPNRPVTTTSKPPSTERSTTTTSTTTASTSSAPRHPITLAEVTALMRDTREAGSPNEYFVPAQSATVPDGAGGTLTAWVGQRHPNAEAAGQVVYFFDDNQFIGWDQDVETDRVRSLRAAGTGDFAISYQNGAPLDPLCCPSRPDVTITYRWTGSKMRGSAVPPHSTVKVSM
jgi:hypothetical protein